MENNKLKKNKEALVLVAHPDDETIWMGGTILKNKEINWTIFSLCRSSDRDRAPKFKKVCDFYKAKSIMTDLDDEGRLSFKQTIKESKKIILDNLKNKNFDYLFTHNTNGEYGHEGHIAVNEAINELIKNNKIKFEKVFLFNYKKISKKEFSPLTIKNDCDYLVNLSKKEFIVKKKIMSDIYGFDPKGIDINYCTNPEGFKELKNIKFKNLSS